MGNVFLAWVSAASAEAILLWRTGTGLTDVVFGNCLSMLGDEKLVAELLDMGGMCEWSGWADLGDDGADETAMAVVHSFLRIASANMPVKTISRRDGVGMWEGRASICRWHARMVPTIGSSMHVFEV